MLKLPICTAAKNKNSPRKNAAEEAAFPVKLVVRMLYAEKHTQKKNNIKSPKKKVVPRTRFVITEVTPRKAVSRTR